MKLVPLVLAVLLFPVASASLYAQGSDPSPVTPLPAVVTCAQKASPNTASANATPLSRDEAQANVQVQAHGQDTQTTPDAPAQNAQPANCSTSDPKAASEDATTCSKEQLVNFETGYDGQPGGTVPIWRHEGSSAFFYESGMTIDADGAPNAYHPDNIGLDDLSNAGGPGSWPGLAKDENGDPIIQGPNDPYPGYYISATALADRDKPYNDPARYVDATKIPFIVLPGGLARQAGARTGDFAMVFNLRNGKSSPAIFADVGPPDHIGEGSIALADNLGIRSDARNGGTRGRVVWLVFAGSGNGRPRPVEEINSEANRLLEQWGGMVRLNACMAEDAPAQ